MPFYKQSSLNNQLNLIHAVNLTENQELFGSDESNYIYILTTQDTAFKANLFDCDFAKSKILLNIYPPW